MKAKPVYLVTFRNSYDKLTCMFTEKFTTVEDAKAAIEFDAEAFSTVHNVKYRNAQKRPSAKWVHPETEDYFEAKCRDGMSCVWQYFKI